MNTSLVAETSNNSERGYVLPIALLTILIAIGIHLFINQMLHHALMIARSHQLKIMNFIEAEKELLRCEARIMTATDLNRIEFPCCQIEYLPSPSNPIYVRLSVLVQTHLTGLSARTGLESIYRIQSTALTNQTLSRISWRELNPSIDINPKSPKHYSNPSLLNQCTRNPNPLDLHSSNSS